MAFRGLKPYQSDTNLAHEDNTNVFINGSATPFNTVPPMLDNI
jgi:hypothetical protein